MKDMPKPQHNHLLGALPDADADRLLPHLEPVWLWSGQSLVEKGGEYQHAFFPTTALVSLVYTEPEVTAEVAIVGADGIVGIPLILGDGVAMYQAFVRSSGRAYRLDGQLLRREFERAESFRILLLRYTLTQFIQASYTSGMPLVLPNGAFIKAPRIS
jgi:hypothetical protein